MYILFYSLLGYPGGATNQRTRNAGIRQHLSGPDDPEPMSGNCQCSGSYRLRLLRQTLHTRGVWQKKGGSSRRILIHGYYKELRCPTIVKLPIFWIIIVPHSNRSELTRYPLSAPYENDVIKFSRKYSYTEYAIWDYFTSCPTLPAVFTPWRCGISSILSFSCGYYLSANMDRYTKSN